MAITPETNLFLIKSPIELDNKNQLTFASKREQLEYFLSLKNIEVENFSYQRKDSVIRFPEHIDNIIEYNYCIYQNSNYSNKWFFAFITNMTYVNDNMTNIYITTDVFQTWQFDLKFKDSFIEREMIDTEKDIPGANLIPEGLETGEFKIDGQANINDLQPAYIVAYTGDNYKISTIEGGATETPVKQEGYSYNGIYSSVTFAVCNEYGFNTLMAILNQEDNSSKILTVFTVPKLAVKSLLPKDDGTHVYYFKFLEDNFMQAPTTLNLNSRPSSIDGYTPRNKKLLTYPYLYLGFTPQNGSKNIYRYENFQNGTPSFKIISEINPNPTVQFIPLNYRGQSGENICDIANLNGYPTVSYRTDTFNNWLAQNGEIISLNMAQEQFNYQIDAIKTPIQGMSSITSQAKNGDFGALLGGANLGLDVARLDKNHEFYIAQQMAQIEKQKMLPDNATLSSSNSTLLGYNLSQNNVFTRFCVKKQFAERIDKFFDMYGYITNTVKKPNINNRPNWNYIKTIGVNIEGYIPQEDLQIIKSIFDNGVTLWHNPNTFLDYSQNNR